LGVPVGAVDDEITGIPGLIAMANIPFETIFHAPATVNISRAILLGSVGTIDVSNSILFGSASGMYSPGTGHSILRSNYASSPQYYVTSL
jgi:hypothetical protein